MSQVRSSTVAIVCPIYATELSPMESRSLAQFGRKLNEYDFYFVAPNNFELSKHRKILAQESFTIEFDPKYFKSIYSYNRLLTSPHFYEKWVAYDYILILQLDCFIFGSNLSYWIEKDYDYVGAPWFSGFTKSTSLEIIGWGNGGLSLRKVDTALSILQRFKWELLLTSPKKLGILKSFYTYLKHRVFKWRLNEDRFWAHLVPIIFPDFRLASLADSIAFSFEKNPRYLYKLNNTELPFGAHAIERYDFDFWEGHIERAERESH